MRSGAVVRIDLNSRKAALLSGACPEVRWMSDGARENPELKRRSDGAREILEERRRSDAGVILGEAF